MPRISAFYGIAIYLYYSDHPPPHIHAIYGEHEAVIEIGTGNVMEGTLPRRAKKLVLEWLKGHRDEILFDWELVRQGQPLQQIDPLE